MKCRHCRIKKRYAPALSTTRSTLLEQSLNNYNKGGTTAICVWMRPNTNRSQFGHVTRQIKQVEKALSCMDMDVPALEASRKLLKKQLTQLRTQQRAQQPLSIRLESVRRALQRAQRIAEEAKVALTLAQTVKEEADQEAARIQSELCILDLEVQKAATDTSARPPHRCSDIIDSTTASPHQGGL